jgi:hypothetical protein
MDFPWSKMRQNCKIHPKWRKSMSKSLILAEIISFDHDFDHGQLQDSPKAVLH